MGTGGTVITVELILRVTLKPIFKCLRYTPMKDAIGYHVNIIFTDSFIEVGAS
jgi:hypothetical protein